MKRGRRVAAIAGLVASTLCGAPASAQEPAPAPAPAPASAPASAFRIAIQTEGAVGVSGSFYNQLVGARLDRCFTSATCLGGYVAYANLKGQSGRANNVLFAAAVEHRLWLGAGWYIPLRASVGYLPDNGPFARLSAGVGVEVGKVDVTLDLLAPALWVTGDDPVFSMDFAAEVAVRF
jgi:hypothetical protein